MFKCIYMFPQQGACSGCQTVYMTLLVGFHRIRFILWKSIHKIFQFTAVLRGELRFERVGQGSLQSACPASTPVMQISAPAGQFTGQVYLHPMGMSYDAYHLAFGQNVTASHTSPLGHMLNTLGRFLLHLWSSPSSKTNGGGTMQDATTRLRLHHRRACVSCGRQLRQDLRQIQERHPSSWSSWRLFSCRPKIHPQPGSGIFPASF